MRLTIRYQWLLPFGIILVIAVAVTSISSAWLAARRSTAITVSQLNRVIEALVESRFPFSQNVLLQMRGLSGAEFATLDANGQLLAHTLPRDALSADLIGEIQQHGRMELLSRSSTLTLHGQRYLVSVISRLNPSTRAETLLVFYPESRWRQARTDAILPPLLVGGVTLGVMFVVSAWLAGRFGRRVGRLQAQVADIAAGDFRQLNLDARNDEIQDLSRSINQMSRQLREMQNTIRQTEQARLLGQLAGGLAHQLRNAIAGARMAIQIHAKRCSLANDDSLEVALRQLELTEEQIRGLLSLGKPERREPVPRPIGALFDEICSLLSPVCNHAGVAFHSELTFDPESANSNCEVPDSGQVRTALLNLILNAIEAAGRGGEVFLSGLCKPRLLVLKVIDTGPGPPSELGDRIFEVFVTGKQEGVGFGLALAHQVAKDHEGSLTWYRENERTVFHMELPMPKY